MRVIFILLIFIINIIVFSENSYSAAPPIFSKTFSPDSILVGGTSTLTFEIQAVTLVSNLDFTDNLPTGVVVANPSNAATDCTGGTITATPGSSMISYSEGAVDNATCSIVVDTTSSSAGVFVNTTGDLTSDQGNSGTATDTLTVLEPVCFAKYTDGTIFSSADGSAVQNAVDAATAGDTVKVAGTCAGVQANGSGTQTLFINKDITIKGGYVVTNWTTPDPLTNPTTLDAQGSGRVVNIQGGTVALEYLTMTNGQAPTADYGGGIYNNGLLTVTNSIVSSSIAEKGGGGIYNSNGSSLTITSSTVSNNNVTSGGGGGIYNPGVMPVTVTGSTIKDNTASLGGGIMNGDTISSADMTVTNCTVSGNIATTSGGGIYNSGTTGVTSSSLTVKGSTVNGNSALTGSGGGIYNHFGSGMTFIFMSNSTVSANMASSGGGIYNDGGEYATLTNCTVSGNTAATEAGGIVNASGSIMSLSNTIIANSTSGADCENKGTLFNNTKNLIEDNTCSPDFSGDPKLGPLQDNGGQTLTHSLLPGSPAINVGDATVCASTTVNGVDQRGEKRRGRCDIGAYETPYTFPWPMFLPAVSKK